MITTLLIQTQKQQDAGIKKDAQYVIDVTWPKDLNCDVDMWIRDPNGKIASFKSKDVGVMHIERDDRGWTEDTIYDMLFGNIKKKEEEINRLPNAETWVLRGKQPGEYNFNVHLYACKVDERSLGLGDSIQVPVQIKIRRLNPTIQDVFEREVILEKIWDEKVVVNFKIKNDNTFDPTVDYVFHDLVRETP